VDIDHSVGRLPPRSGSLNDCFFGPSADQGEVFIDDQFPASQRVNACGDIDGVARLGRGDSLP